MRPSHISARKWLLTLPGVSPYPLLLALCKIPSSSLSIRLAVPQPFPPYCPRLFGCTVTRTLTRCRVFSHKANVRIKKTSTVEADETPKSPKSGYNRHPLVMDHHESELDNDPWEDDVAYDPDLDIVYGMW